MVDDCLNLTAKFNAAGYARIIEEFCKNLITKEASMPKICRVFCFENVKYFVS
jgi:hypothetical protein